LFDEAGIEDPAAHRGRRAKPGPRPRRAIAAATAPKARGAPGRPYCRFPVNAFE